jgi:hypothetical protein
MSFESFVAMLAGLFLRIGLPILVTALLAWILHRLDERWQQEIKQEQQMGFREVAIQRERCWQIKRCSPERRNECIAFLEPAIHCWEHFRNGRRELRESCLDCEVFRNVPVPLAA